MAIFFSFGKKSPKQWHDCVAKVKSCIDNLINFFLGFTNQIKRKKSNESLRRIKSSEKRL